MQSSDLVAVFLLGLAGSGHCVGMCAAFGIAVSGGAPRLGALGLRHVAYQIGKGTSYAFLGVLLLLASDWAASEWPVLELQRWIGRVVGGIMIATGTLLLTEWRIPASWAGKLGARPACDAIAALWRSPSLAKSVLVGWVNGFLPCGLSLVALLYLAREGSVIGTVVGAYVFTLGTLPSLLLVGWLGQRFSLRSRRWMVRASGALLIVFGAFTLVRDEPQVHGALHRLMPSLPGSVPADHSHHGH